MNWILSRLNEGGIIEAFQKRDEPYNRKQSNKDNSEKIYGMKDFASCFYILLGGTVLGGWTLGVFAILIEFIIYEKRKCNKILDLAAALDRIHISEKSW